ncbi:MAG: hypothetical protein IKD79_06340 [Oscillospiraceae bacterium]|nr:hypothetical protein [Oscillospiraceae bacterium]
MDRMGFYAGMTDLLSEMCVYYVVVGVMGMGRRGWSTSIFWILLLAAACCVFFRLFLRKQRSVPLLTAVTVVLFAAVTACLIGTTATTVRFGYGLLLAFGAGMAVGLALYYAVNRPGITRHLSHLDALILVMLMLVLCGVTMELEEGAVAAVTVILLMDVAAAIGLRMTDGDGANGGNAFRAAGAALAAGVLLLLIILLLTALFSRSGAVTESILRGIGRALAALWNAIDRFMFWLVSLLKIREDSAPLELERPALPSVEDVEYEMVKIPLNTTVIAVVLSLLVLAAAFAVARQLRREKISVGAGVGMAHARATRSGGWLGRAWRELMRLLRFHWTAFTHRDTPGGVLLFAERMGRRTRRPRGTGESMREFIRRMDPGGGLDELSDALDREYYGGGSGLSARRCRELRRYIRKAVRNG